MHWLHLFPNDKKQTPLKASGSGTSPLRILCFEIAKTMSRLLSLYRSLSDDEINKLRTEVVVSKGVAYLNSGDEDHLLRLASAEFLEKLDNIAASVARVGEKCSSDSSSSSSPHGLVRFEILYEELRQGIIDQKKIGFGSRNARRIVEKMEKLVTETANLYSAWESLTELENSERKINLKQFGKIANIEMFHEKIVFLRKQVHTFKEASLWSQTYDGIVDLIARLVCVVYARIYVVFAQYYVVPGLDCSPVDYCVLDERNFHLPRTKKSRKNVFPTAFDRITGCDSTTVGGTALSVRYANVIVLADRCLHAPDTVSDSTREELYELLPEGLRRTVRAKLRKWREEVGGRDWHALAEGWREATEDMLMWLAPMGHNTMTWLSERSFGRQARYFECTVKPAAEPSVLLIQTLYYSDLEKTEAAIIEVLVGLSCVFWYEKPPLFR